MRAIRCCTQFGALGAAFPAALLANATVAAAVHAPGFHYPHTGSSLPPNVAAVGKAVWASEDDSTVSPPRDAEPTPHPRALPGGGCLARTINQNYVAGNMTATIVWNLVMARYPQLRWDYTGLMSATDPFEGHYDVNPRQSAHIHLIHLGINPLPTTTTLPPGAISRLLFRPRASLLN